MLMFLSNDVTRSRGELFRLIMTEEKGENKTFPDVKNKVEQLQLLVIQTG